MATGGDNYTKMLGVMVDCFEDVNVGSRTENVWALNARLTDVSGPKLFGFIDACRETDSVPALVAGDLIVLGKN